MSDQTPAEILKGLVSEHFPHGDPEFYNITTDELDLYNRKNKDYAGGGDPNGNFKRCAAFWSQYPGVRLSDPRVVALSYMMKQLDQVCWSLSRGYEGAIEGLDERFVDIHIYAKIARVINRSLKAENSDVGASLPSDCIADLPPTEIPEMSQEDFIKYFSSESGVFLQSEHFGNQEL